MNAINDKAGQKIAFPFYIFLSLLLGFLGVASVRSVWLGGERGIAIFAATLFLFHIGLYWMNFSQTDRGTGWWIFYYLAQTALMVSLVLLLNGRSTMGLSFLFSSTISIVGEALGVWGNSRRSFWLGTFYIGLLIYLLFVFSERAQFYDSLAGLLVNGGAILLFMVMYNQQLIERQKAVELAESLESANAKLAASAAKIEWLTLQNERQRMARELHDTLAQGVTGLVLQLEAVKAHLASNRKERASTIVDQAITRARGTLAESRAAIDDLRAAPADISESVHEKIDRFKQATGLPIEMEISIAENQLAPETVNHALNILSESLTNIARHAQATQVKVKCIVHGQTLNLEVRDNGRGFDVNQNAGGHYGLLGMHERARLTGGTLTIESDQNGTRVHFVVGRS